MLNHDSNLTEGCLFTNDREQYSELPEARGALDGRHTCRYFDTDVMRRLCASLGRAGDKADHRGTTYAEQYFPWWCRGL